MSTPFYPDPNADTPRGTTRLAIDSTTNATPIKVKTTVNHGYGSGDRVEIEGTADPNAAGQWNITVTSVDEFTLDGSAGSLAGGVFGTVTNWTILPNTLLPSDGDLVDASNANTPVENALNLGAYPGLNSRYRLIDVYNQRVADTTPVTNSTWSTTTPLTAAYAWAQNNPVWGTGLGESPSINPILIDGDFLDITFAFQITYAAAGVLGAIAVAISDDGTNIYPVKGTDSVLPTAGVTQYMTLSGRVYAVEDSPAFNAPGHIFSVGLVVYGNGAGPTYTMHGSYSLVMKHYRFNG